MKLLGLEVENVTVNARLAYYHPHWTRDGATLLDELGAVIDHVEAFSTVGPCSEANLCTACAKCNGRKSSASLDKMEPAREAKPIEGKYGEPQHWHGLTSVFVMLAKRNPAKLT